MSVNERSKLKRKIQKGIHKLELKKGDKYTTKKSIDILEKELEHLNTKIKNPVLVEDLL